MSIKKYIHNKKGTEYNIGDAVQGDFSVDGEWLKGTKHIKEKRTYIIENITPYSNGAGFCITIKGEKYDPDWFESPAHTNAGKILYGKD